MALPAPNLDNRRFADIYGELRDRIERYTNEWRDLNDSDPGVTLLQLFAWMTEGTLYRLNQVPERMHVKFLELLGIQLRPAEPATVELAFIMSQPAVDAVVSVPRRTRVAASGGADGRPVVFETDESMEALAAPLRAVLAYDAYDYADVTAANEAAAGYEPFGPVARRHAGLYLGFTWPGQLPSVTVRLYVSAGGTTPPPWVSCGANAVVAPAEVVWEAWVGTRWMRLGVDSDDTLAFTRSGYVLVHVRGDLMATMPLGPVAEHCYWVRARLETATYERAPRIDGISPNSVPASQAETVVDEALGSSDGRPNQMFRVFSTPVVSGSLVLEVHDGTGYEPWTEVADFTQSTRDDRHYTLDRAAGLITFGDGIEGRIPIASVDAPSGAGVVARRYRFGGGSAGLVPAGAVSQLQSGVPGVARVVNRQPSSGGRDEETIEEAKKRAAGLLKSRTRAVTNEDFETLAKEAQGAKIARAIARPLTHPSFPGVTVPGAVTVVVIPDAPGARPMPSEATMLNVCRHLDRHRLLTTEVHVAAPVYRKVEVHGRVMAEPAADLGAVRRAVVDALDAFFHAIHGGRDGTGWPLGGTIFYSVVYKTMLVRGVARVDEMAIVLDGEEHPFCKDVPIGPGELLWADGHQIEAAYE